MYLFIPTVLSLIQRLYTELFTLPKVTAFMFTHMKAATFALNRMSTINPDRGELRHIEASESVPVLPDSLAVYYRITDVTGKNILNKIST